jgi:hypothetical protein
MKGTQKQTQQPVSLSLADQHHLLADRLELIAAVSSRRSTVPFKDVMQLASFMCRIMGNYAAASTGGLQPDQLLELRQVVARLEAQLAARRSTRGGAR